MDITSDTFLQTARGEDGLRDMLAVLDDIEEEKSPSDILAGSFPDFSSGNEPFASKKNIFEESGRQAWNKEHVLARCDMQYILKISPRCGVNFISVWKKSLYGRLLSEIKEDDDMVEVFAETVGNTITDVLGKNLSEGGWAIVTAPRRRHVERNFATLVSLRIADRLHIPFYEDIIHCKSKQRMNAVFTISQVPSEPNIIVFDDIVTTGSTLASIKQAFEKYNKNLLFFTGINNKL